MASEWHIPQPFNPGSAPQKLALIKHFGLKPPKKRGEDRETTEAKFLKRFAKKHPVFGTIIDCQQREKLISTYMWPGGADGRVRTIYTFAPSTWRKSSRAVNLQNTPKRSDLAQLFRRMLIAAPRHLLLEVDSSAIEAVIVGFCAGDADYIRMAQLGIHDFVTAKWVGIPVDASASAADLRRIFKEVKANYHSERESAKRAVHGSNYCLTPYGLNDEYPEFFPTKRKGEEFQEFYFSLFPRLRQWHQSTLERAHKECYLDNHYGYRHYFYSVFQWDKRRQAWALGDDAKRAVAFVPQSDACVSPNSRILRTDLTWARADEVKVGDELLAFDEHAGSSQGRRYRASQVLDIHKITLPRVRVYTDQGVVIVSEEHPFLAERPTYGGKYWIKARDLKAGCRISYFAAPWDGDYSRDGGYLAGFFDGEGWCGKTRIGFGQNKGPTLDHVQELLKARGFRFNLMPAWHPGSKAIRPGKTQMRGDLRTMRDALRFLGTIRPSRLMENARQLWEGRRTGGKAGAPVARVNAVVSDGLGEVIAIKTSTATYISDGMFSHNSAIQTEDVLELAAMPEVEPYLRLIIHDSTVLEIPEAEVEKVARMVLAVMTRPRPELGGLVIGAEAKVGRNLGDHDPVANPSGMKTLTLGAEHESSEELPGYHPDPVAGGLHHGSDPCGPAAGLADRP